METPPILELAALTILEMDKDGVNAELDPAGFGRAYVILKTALNPEEVQKALLQGFAQSGINARAFAIEQLAEQLAARFINAAIGKPENIQRLTRG